MIKYYEDKIRFPLPLLPGYVTQFNTVFYLAGDIFCADKFKTEWALFVLFCPLADAKELPPTFFRTQTFSWWRVHLSTVSHPASSASCQNKGVLHKINIAKRRVGKVYWVKEKWRHFIIRQTSEFVYIVWQ